MSTAQRTAISTIIRQQAQGFYTLLEAAELIKETYISEGIRK